MNNETITNAFNEALNYALDEANEGLTFLRMWREGDWPGIKQEYPDFDLTNALVVNGVDVVRFNPTYDKHASTVKL